MRRKLILQRNVHLHSLMLFEEFPHVVRQGFSVLQRYSIIQRRTHSSHWPAGGDKRWPPVLTAQVHKQIFTSLIYYLYFSHTDLCPFSDIIPSFDAPSRNFFSKASSPSFFPTRKGTFMRLRQVVSTGHLNTSTHQWASSVCASLQSVPLIAAQVHPSWALWTGEVQL